MTTETVMTTDFMLAVYRKWQDVTLHWPGDERWRAERDVSAALRAGDFAKARRAIDEYEALVRASDARQALTNIITAGELLTGLMRRHPDACVKQDGRQWHDLEDLGRSFVGIGAKTRGAAKASNTRFAKRIDHAVRRAREQRDAIDRAVQ